MKKAKHLKIVFEFDILLSGVRTFNSMDFVSGGVIKEVECTFLT